MSLTTYCEFGEVRSALGVNDLELPDSVLTLPVYEMGLIRELNKLSTSLAASFSTVQNKQRENRTELEQALFSATRLFSVYLVASQVGVSLPNFAPKSVGDGKATVSRFAGEPYERVMERVTSHRDSYRKELRQALADFVAGAASQAPSRALSMAVASTRAYDPVAGS